MARTFLDMAKSLERRATRLGFGANERSKRVAMSMVKYLAYNTPVDVSTALSNWILELNEKPMRPRGAFFPGTHGSTQSASAENTVLFARAILERKKPGDIIYISNLLPYIRKLNDGSSSQSPGGFVEAALIVGRKTA